MTVRFKDVVVIAGQVNSNKLCFTKEALAGAVEDIKKLPFGVLCDRKIVYDPPRVADAAFIIKGAEFDGQRLEVTIETLDVPAGRKAEMALVSPGEMSLGMRGEAQDGGSETLEDGTLVVSDFKCTMISLLPTKDKA
jgi:hypothetical protein